MNRLLVAAAAAAAIALPAAAATATANPQRAAAAGKFIVVFAPPKNSDEQILVSLLKQAQMPLVFSELTKHMILPRNITISVQGGDAGPYYSPQDADDRPQPPVLGARAQRTGSDRSTRRSKPYDIGYHFAELEYFVLFHEVGHALVDQWDIPVLGREEDAVDAFSTIFMTEIVKRGDFALAGAEFFLDLDKLTGANGQLDFADEHSFNKQRAYSIACWVYGSDPAKWSTTNLKTFLPAARRVRCADEYRKLKKAWFGLLKPHLRASRRSR